MAYKQVKKYGYRDSLEKGDPEKVIYGVDFDAEFEAIEEAFGNIFGEDGAVGPDDPAFEQVVFQNRPEPQRVVSEFSFERLGDGALTVKSAGLWANSDAAYFQYRYGTDVWVVKPGLDVEGNLNVDGDIDATGNLNVDQNVTIGGQIDGDLTVNGNIIIDGGSIIDGGGAEMGFWKERGDYHIKYTFGGDGTNSGGIEIEHTGLGSTYYMEILAQRLRIGKRGGTGYLGIDSNGGLICDSINAGNAISAPSFKKHSGTADQLLCADGSVVDKGSVGGSGPDLSAYYTKTESDNKYEPKFQKKTGFNKDFGTAAGTVSQGNHTHSYSSLTDKPTLYTGADAVKTTGNQEIAGIKTFSSDIRCKANVYAYYGSDERLKDDITPMPIGLIDAIDASTWKWKEDGRSSGGVIAQQLQEVGLDDWVRESPDGDLGVDYNALIGMLIAEVQDLKRRLADG